MVAFLGLQSCRPGTEGARWPPPRWRWRSKAVLLSAPFPQKCSLAIWWWKGKRVRPRRHRAMWPRPREAAKRNVRRDSACRVFAIRSRRPEALLRGRTAGVTGPRAIVHTEHITLSTLRRVSSFLATALLAVAQQYSISTIAGNGPNGAPTPFGNIAGNWQLLGKSTVSTAVINASGQITQIGDNVSGQLSVGRTLCATSAALSGTVSNTGVIALSLNENGQVVTFSGTLSGDGNSAAGTYIAPLGGCTNGDKGTWSGQRLPTPSVSAGDGGLAIAATLDTPYGVALDGGGAFYITEVGTNQTDSRVRKVSSSGVITTIAGNSIKGFAGDGGQSISSVLDEPFGVYADTSGSIYIADTGNMRVRKISPNGIITTIAGIGPVSPGQVYPIAGVPAVNAVLYNPTALAQDSQGNLYIAQGGSNVVSKVSVNGIITTIVGNLVAGNSGDGGSGAKAQLNAPFGVAIDASGNLFIADSNNARIRKVSTAGIITTVAGNGTSGYGGDGGPATNAQLARPCGVALDSVGNLFIADTDNNRIRNVSANGIISTIAGTGVSGYSGDGGAATSAALNGPISLSVDSAGNVLVADTQNNTIRVLRPAGSSPSISSITNAATNLSGAIAPGEIVVLYGSGIGPTQLVVASVGSDGLFDTQLAGTSVTINGALAPMIYASATQTSAIVPYGIAGVTAQVTVARQGQVTAPLSAPIASSAAGIFSLDSTGKGQAAAINQDGTINGASAPARVGDIVSLFATGEGQTTPLGVDGKLAIVPLPRPNLTVRATVGGQPAQVQYAGGAPGEVAGLMQVNVQVPVGIQTSNSVPVVLLIGNASSQIGVTIAVR